MHYIEKAKSFQAAPWTSIKSSWFGHLRPPHTTQTHTNSQLLFTDHSVASCLTYSAEKLH